MLTALILAVFATAALVLILLSLVVIVMRQEPRDTELTNVAPCLTAAMVRRLLGVYVRRPTPPADGLIGDSNDRLAHDDRGTKPTASQRR
jgi:hypothetical protein